MSIHLLYYIHTYISIIVDDTTNKNVTSFSFLNRAYRATIYLRFFSLINVLVLTHLLLLYKFFAGHLNENMSSGALYLWIVNFHMGGEDTSRLICEQKLNVKFYQPLCAEIVDMNPLNKLNYIFRVSCPVQSELFFVFILSGCKRLSFCLWIGI